MLVKYALYENKYDFTGTDLISIDTREQVMEIVPDLLTTDQMQIKNVEQTHSPSMDIQISSNFERQIYESLKKNSKSVNAVMNSFSKNNNYQFDLICKLF